MRHTPNRPAVEFPKPELIVKYWSQLSNTGPEFPIRSSFVERFWLPILGPTTILLLRRLDLELQLAKSPIKIKSLEWSTSLGLGTRGGRNSPFWRSIERACRFETACLLDNQLLIKQTFGPLDKKHLSSLSQQLQSEHVKATETYQLQRT